jgi:Protein of unknown function (DUF3098)
MAGKGLFLFAKRNYYLILIAVGLIVSGYLLMTGSGNYQGQAFNEDIYSFRRITLAPVILLMGYSLMIFAIMTVWKTKNSNEKNGRSR